MKQSNSNMTNLPLLMHFPPPEFFHTLIPPLHQITHLPSITPTILFLHPNDNLLLSTYKQTTPSHPLATTPLPLQAIA
ncbi:RNase adapter RapZ, partial [Bacillus altitudinis]|uniref:RNase adapter RapZ n=1 Tax=Bacillus altitudinis TaxID=293387 RepID=UPI003B526837